MPDNALERVSELLREALQAEADARSDADDGFQPERRIDLLKDMTSAKADPEQQTAKWISREIRL